MKILESSQTLLTVLKRETGEKRGMGRRRRARSRFRVGYTGAHPVDPSLAAPSGLDARRDVPGGRAPPTSRPRRVPRLAPSCPTPQSTCPGGSRHPRERVLPGGWARDVPYDDIEVGGSVGRRADVTLAAVELFARPSVLHGRDLAGAEPEPQGRELNSRSGFQR